MTSQHRAAPWRTRAWQQSKAKGRTKQDDPIKAFEFDPTLPTVRLSYDTSTNMWTTVNSVHVKLKQFGQNVTIGSGFEFDLASVPRPVWSLIAPFELGIVAPLVHDYLYVHKGRLEETSQFFTRKEADQIFLELMEREGINWWRRTAAYRAVRLGNIGRKWGRRPVA